MTIFGGRLDLTDVDRFAHRVELHESTQCHQTVRCVVDMRGIAFEHVVVAALGGLLEQEDRLGVVEMLLTGAAPLVFAAVPQHTVRCRRPLVRICLAVADRHLLGQVVEPAALDTGYRAGEVLVDHGAVEADGFEQLGTTVAHDRGDAHLAHDLEHAGGKRIAQILVAVSGSTVT